MLRTKPGLCVGEKHHRDLGRAQLAPIIGGRSESDHHQQMHRCSIRLLPLAARRLPQAARLLPRRLMSTSASGAHREQRTFLGVSLGVTAGAVSFSVVAWPLADLFGAPKLIAMAAKSPSPQSAGFGPADLEVAEAAGTMRTLLGAGGSGAAGQVCMVIGGTQEHRSALVSKLGAGRPVIRLSLREGTSPHALMMALVEQLYKPLGPRWGQLVSSMGLYWLTLFDLVVADHQHTRSTNFTVVLSHVRRALERLTPEPDGGTNAGAATPQRPLIVVEQLHVPEQAARRDAAVAAAVGDGCYGGGGGLDTMLRSLRQHLCAVSVDDGLADVVVLAPRRALAAWADNHVEGATRAERSWLGRRARVTAPDAAAGVAGSVSLGHGLVGVAMADAEAAEMWLETMWQPPPPPARALPTSARPVKKARSDAA